MKALDRREHMKGTLYARGFLRRTQAALQERQQVRPQMLRWEYQIVAREKSGEYQAGFLDVIGAHLVTTLEGVLVDLYRWQFLRELERMNGKR